VSASGTSGPADNSTTDGRRRQADDCASRIPGRIASCVTVTGGQARRIARGITVTRRLTQPGRGRRPDACDLRATSCAASADRQPEGID
jgi:hypothetical protein